MIEKTEIDKVVEYTKQFIEAATPIAKQAYETGLVTLRIDAAQILIFGFSAVLVAILLLRWVRSEWVKAKAKADAARPESQRDVWKRRPSSHLAADGIPHALAMIAAGFALLIGTSFLLNIWTWAKLFAPELWLAHMAVSKLLGN